MIGRDLVRDGTTPGRALIQFNDYFAWLEDSSATVLRPGLSALAGQYDPMSGILKFHDGSPDESQVRKAKAHVMIPSLLYREQRYKLPR
jgi:hypothetical protein